jgi:hypothetical protein
MSKLKCRKYDTKYFPFGFTNTDVDGEEGLRCLFRRTILAVDSMKPNKLKRYFKIVHAECVGKTPEFFHRKLSEFNKEKEFAKITTSKPLVSSSEKP